MSDGRGQEYLDENFCTHDDVYVNGFEIINNQEDVLVNITCCKCGESQQHTLDLGEIILDLDLGWNE
jgi:hypothetical protein